MLSRLQKPYTPLTLQSHHTDENSAVCLITSAIQNLSAGLRYIQKYI